MGESHCCCVVASCGVCVGCGSSETWRQNSDALTRVYICTLTHSHTLYLGEWLIVASLGVLEEVQKNHFSFKQFFSLSRWFGRHRYYRIHSCLSLLYRRGLSVLLPLPLRPRGDKEVATLSWIVFQIWQFHNRHHLLNHQVMPSNMSSGSRWCCLFPFAGTE